MPKPSKAELLALAKKLKAEQARVPEVIAPPADTGWSAADPASMDRAIQVVMLRGDGFPLSMPAEGCPQEAWLQIISDPRFSDRFRSATELSMLPALPGALKAAMDSGAYGTKIAFEIARGIKGDEAEAQQTRALKSGGLKARIRALDDIIKEAARQREVLTGGHAPLPDELAEIVRSVTTQDKQLAS